MEAKQYQVKLRDSITPIVLAIAFVAVVFAYVQAQPPAPPPTLTIAWNYPVGVTNAVFVIYSKYDLGGTNNWYLVGTVTNQLAANIILQRKSGLPLKRAFFQVMTFSAP